MTGENELLEAGRGLLKAYRVVIDRIADDEFDIAAEHPASWASKMAAAIARAESQPPALTEALSRPSPVVGEGAVAWPPRTLTMPNGEVLHCEYPQSPVWARSWSIFYPDLGRIGTTGEQDDELVDRYGLTAILEAARLYAAPSTTQTGGDDGAKARVMAVLNYWFDGTRRIDPESEMVTQLAALASPLVGSGQGSSAKEADTHRAPDGWVLVPREPTPAMLQGACEKHTPGAPMSDRSGGERECPRFDTRRMIWRRMIEAAVSTAEQPGTQSPLGDGVNPTPSQQQGTGQ